MLLNTVSLAHSERASPLLAVMQCLLSSIALAFSQCARSVLRSLQAACTAISAVAVAQSRISRHQHSILPQSLVTVWFRRLAVRRVCVYCRVLSRWLGWRLKQRAHRGAAAAIHHSAHNARRALRASRFASAGRGYIDEGKKSFHAHAPSVISR
jgi:hypothetical protein